MSRKNCLLIYLSFKSRLKTSENQRFLEFSGGIESDQCMKWVKKQLKHVRVRVRILFGPHSARMRENADQKNRVICRFFQFSCSNAKLLTNDELVTLKKKFFPDV